MAGAERIFTEDISSSARNRPELDKLLDQLRVGDVIVVTKYDRLARGLRDLGGGALGSTGGNRVFGNTGTDLRVDLDGLELKAEDNWWGDAAGLLPARVTLDAASTVDVDPFLATDPQAD